VNYGSIFGILSLHGDAMYWNSMKKRVVTPACCGIFARAKDHVFSNFGKPSFENYQVRNLRTSLLMVCWFINQWGATSMGNLDAPSGKVYYSKFSGVDHPGVAIEMELDC